MDKFTRYILPAIVCIIGAGFIAWGVINGEMQLVLTKAIRICLECIGIG